MEARIVRGIAPRTNSSSAIIALLLFAKAATVQAAGYRTVNFTVDAPTPRLAKEIGDAAEHYRSQLAQEWLGKKLPNWSQPCPIKARVSPGLGAGGATSFVFDRGEVFGWRMDIQGSRERILDSVVPHEVTHTIFASHFRQPIPRWADEGACTTVEHRSEVSKQENLLIEILQTRRGIPFSNMFAMKEYPRDVLPLYAQGHSLATYLIAQRGKREFLAFIEDGLMDEDWIGAIRDRYGYRNLLELQNSWQNWVVQGRPPIPRANDAQAEAVLVASRDTGQFQPTPSTGVRQAVVASEQDPGNYVSVAPADQSAASGIDGPLAEIPDGHNAAVGSWVAGEDPQHRAPDRLAKQTAFDRPMASVYNVRPATTMPMQ